MNLTGRDRYENLSHAGGPNPLPPVRFGDVVVPASVAWILEPIGKSPAVRAEFEMRRGRPVCTSLEVQATPTGRPVTTADLATLPGLDRKALDALKALALAGAETGEWDFVPDGRRVGAALRARPDDELQRVAEVYRANVDGNPTEAVESLGYTRRTAARRVQQARARGLLPATTPGKRKA